MRSRAFVVAVVLLALTPFCNLCLQQVGTYDYVSFETHAIALDVEDFRGCDGQVLSAGLVKCDLRERGRLELFAWNNHWGHVTLSTTPLGFGR